MRYQCTIVPIFGPVTSETVEADSMDEARLTFAGKHGKDEPWARKYACIEAVVETAVEAANK